ncbi:neutral zinc metallopeptidase [Shigella flexneri]
MTVSTAKSGASRTRDDHMALLGDSWFKRGFDSGNPAQCNTFGKSI